MSAKMVALMVLAVAMVLFAGMLWAYAAKEEEAPSPMPAPAQDIYRVIGEWEGHVAVFYPNSHTPERVYDTMLVTLPVEARQQLHQGVPVSGYDMLQKRLEDYLS